MERTFWPCGASVVFRGGHVTSGKGIHPKPDVTLAFKTAAIGAGLLMPPINWLDQINAQKDFKLTVEGNDALINWFARTVMQVQTLHWEYGTPQADGSIRYCNMANGGPLFVYVKDGKIIRTTPIEFDDNDGASWSIKAKGWW